MPNVVIIHAADDTLPARALSEKLQQTQAQVTLEHTPGQKLRLAIDAADLVIALWSPRALGQAALVEDVRYARDIGKVLHASMQSAALPEPFGGDPSVNLTGWRGEDNFAPWRQLAGLVTTRIGAAPLAPPAPRAPSGLFNPASTPTTNAPSPISSPETPPPRRPEPAPFTEPPPLNVAMPGFEPEERGGGRTLLYAALAILAVGVAGAGGFMLLGQRGNGAQATSLEDVDIGDASALREFIASAASRAEREQAEDALDTLEQQSLDAARDENTIEAFEAFLRDFPESEEAVFVQGQIQQIRLRQADEAAATALAPPLESPAAMTIEAPTAGTSEPVPLNVPPPQTGEGGPADLSPPPPEAETPPS